MCIRDRRKLLQSAGRTQALGRPTLYRTTDEFLRHFGLSDLSQLPPLPEDVDLSDVLSEEESSTGETPPPVSYTHLIEWMLEELQNP